MSSLVCQRCCESLDEGLPAFLLLQLTSLLLLAGQQEGLPRRPAEQAPRFAWHILPTAAA